MKTFSAETLSAVGVDLFEACGAPREEALTVADSLVEASLVGLDSHGVIRFVQYVEDCLAGFVKPGAPIRILNQTPTQAVVDCGFNFGQVGASRMLEIACEKAALTGMAFTVSRHCYHVGRVGAYVQQIAERGLIGLAVASGSQEGHFVVPWGGREGKLTTSPIAFGAPGPERPLVVDMSTSMISEGKIRALLHAGEQLPEGCILDAEGLPSTDPNAFYGPPKGVILPFGGGMGYKGFGLGMIVQILGTVMSAESATADYTCVNGFSLIVIDSAPLIGGDAFDEAMATLVAHVTSSAPAPGFDGVVLPGQLEFETRERRLREGIPLPGQTRTQIVETGATIGVSVDL